MNRHIKFRAWDGKYKKMHYKVSVGNVHDKENYTAHAMYLNSGDTDYHIPDGGQWMHFDEHSDCQLMQFTGLTDKNGKEIYEGDIVKTHNNLKYKIEYSDNDACFYLKPLYSVSSKENYHLYEIAYSNVIGNIYENPELLTTK